MEVQIGCADRYFFRSRATEERRDSIGFSFVPFLSKCETSIKPQIFNELSLDFPCVIFNATADLS